METKTGNFQEVDMEMIDRPDEIVRLSISEDSLRELAASIKSVGLLQPIILTPAKGRYMIVAGDRRFLAVDMLGWKKIMASLCEMTPEEVALVRGIENLQRDDLTPYEEAILYKGLIEKRNFTLEELSRRSGKKPGTIQRRLDILDMPDSFQKALHSRKISPSVAEELWHCPTESRREYFLDLAVVHGITQKIARDWVNEWKQTLRTKAEGGGDGPPGSAPYRSIPTYRGCDTCLEPYTWDNLKNLVVCEECHGLIMDMIKEYEKQAKAEEAQRRSTQGTA